ncbi:hypothetical protein FACS189492_0350 [Clostridia bacterium]|nr:hypothetical protein FACS189492_0350 [Clostridia bacterium]
MDKNQFPKEMATFPNWVCWRLETDKNGRDTKVPYSPQTGRRASASNPATWGTLDEALYAKEKYLFHGVGFTFDEKCDIIGIDIDHCLDGGVLNAVTLEILAKLPPTYIEISPSGTGLHIFLKGKLGDGGNRNSKVGVEMYSSARYFTMTGNRWRDCADTIAADNGAIAYIHQTFIAPPKRTSRRASAATAANLSDDEILRLAQTSKDGDAFSALWSGGWQGKHNSQSEADFALCRKLAFWTARNETQIHRLFRKSALFRQKWDERHSAGGLTYGEQTVSKACSLTTQIYMPPDQKRETEIFEQGSVYYRRKGEKTYQITNFIIEPIEMVLSEDRAQITCDFVTDTGEKIRQQLDAEDFVDTKSFKSVIGKKTFALSFRGNGDDLDAFKIHVYNNLEWVKKRGKKALGIYQHNGELVFVTPSGAVGADNVAVTDIVPLEEYRSIECNILSAPMIDKAGLLLIAEHILRYNEPAKTVPILAWTAGCFIKPPLKKAGIKFPHLFLIGEPGSGKSNSMEKIIYPMVGQTRVYAASQVTSFTMMKEADSSNVIPILLDEFKPSKMKGKGGNLHSLYNHFRDAYDWHKGVRGRPDQTQTFYDLLAPIVVAGEESADEGAIRERTIEVLFSKKDLRIDGAEAAFEWIRANEKLVRSFGRSLLDIALRTTIEETAEWHDEGTAYFSRELPSRIRDNLCACYAGLCLVNKLCQYLGATFDGAFPIDHERCAAYLETAAREYLLEDSTYNKGTVEDALEVMSYMRLKYGEDYTFENGNQYLVIYLKQAYNKYTRYRSDYKIEGEVLPRAQFMKQLGKSVYCVDKSVTKRFGKETHRAWVLDFDKLSKACDVSDFLRDEETDE